MSRGMGFDGAGSMTLREKASPLELEAHEVLDRVRAGLEVSQRRVMWALLVLGEPAV